MPSLDGSTYTIRIKYGEDLLLEMEGRAVQLNPWELERMLDLFNDFADVLGRR